MFPILFKIGQPYLPSGCWWTPLKNLIYGNKRDACIWFCKPQRQWFVKTHMMGSATPPPSHIIAHPHVCIAVHIKSQRYLSFYKVSFCIMFLQQLATSNIHNSEAVTPISDETGTGRNKPQRDLSFQRLPSASDSYNNLQPRTFITWPMLRTFRITPTRIATNPIETYRLEGFLVHQVLATTRNFEYS